MAGKINILYMSRTSKLTGPENILIDIIRRLDKGIFSPVVVLPDRNGPFFKKLQLHKINTKIKKMPFLRVTYNPFLLLWFFLNILILNFNFLFTLKKYNINLVVCNTIQEALYLSIPVKILKRKLMICFKNILDSRWKKKLRAGFCSIFADSIIAVSEKALEDYTLFSSKKRSAGKLISVIHDGIDCREFKRGFKEIDVMSKYRGESKGFIILNIGNLTELKGQMLLLESVSSNKIKNLNIKVLLLGDVYHRSEMAYKEKIKKYINENNLEKKVSMLGYRPDIGGYLNSADVLVHCPIKEDAFPRVVLEAFCFGRIVIATRMGGIPEMIKDNHNGFLCEADKNSLADKILYVYENRNKLGHIGKNALKSVVEEFNISSQLRETEKIYNKLSAL
ncbi:MAG TPA: glycosyltransferase family 4 protein [Candidatus Humimicrobiaceae bacterium]